MTCYYYSLSTGFWKAPDSDQSNKYEDVCCWFWRRGMEGHWGDLWEPDENTWLCVPFSASIMAENRQKQVGCMLCLYKLDILVYVFWLNMYFSHYILLQRTSLKKWFKLWFIFFPKTCVYLIRHTSNVLYLLYLQISDDDDERRNL